MVSTDKHACIAIVVHNCYTTTITTTTAASNITTTTVS